MGEDGGRDPGEGVGDENGVREVMPLEALEGAPVVIGEADVQVCTRHADLRIRAARQALGWTQNDLAKKANVSPRTIHAVEKGRPCRQATKRHILNALGVPWELRDEYFVRARSVRAVPAHAAAIRTA